MGTSMGFVRALALSLADTTEQPHHSFGSFRVRGRIFLTVPPGDERLHVFLPDDQRDLALAMDPQCLEPLVWGSKVVGVRVRLSQAPAHAVKRLVTLAYAYKAAGAAARPRPAARARPPRGVGGP